MKLKIAVHDAEEGGVLGRSAYYSGLRNENSIKPEN